MTELMIPGSEYSTARSQGVVWVMGRWMMDMNILPISATDEWLPSHTGARPLAVDGHPPCSPSGTF